MKNKLFLCILAISFLLSCKKEDNNTSQTVTTSNVSSNISTGSWRITYFFDSNQDETADFSGYTFDFASGGVLTATRSGETAITGTWTTGTDDSQVKLILAFSTPAAFNDLSDDWHVTEQTDTRIVLEDVSGGNGGTDYLTFEKN